MDTSGMKTSERLRCGESRNNVISYFMMSTAVPVQQYFVMQSVMKYLWLYNCSQEFNIRCRYFLCVPASCKFFLNSEFFDYFVVNDCEQQICSILLLNEKLSDILGELQGIVKGFERSKENGVTDTDLSDALASQVRRLATEVRQLASSHPVILNGNPNQTGVISFVVPAAAIGALSYGYLRLKGISISDLMYVTKRNMANAVASMSKHFEQVSAALAATKKHLTQRIENLDGKLDEQKEISNVIRQEVGDANKLIENLSMNLNSIQQLVSNMDDKVNSMVDKQDVSPKHAVLGKRFLDHLDTGCLKGLQHIVDETENFNLAIASGCSSPR
ncbi:hypothetical protein LUZ61_012771 [Rhynchospora tenuis]|uniref:DUF1664 domain-containing protein n=1 Tax=Rhynchospora tenuis TaxID=198213 RepID=A0AAD6A3I4_9POAL|nr:hypothetical protein LUZ61_012771 [Rhynchospora tenuis]